MQASFVFAEGGEEGFWATAAPIIPHPLEFFFGLATFALLYVVVVAGPFVLLGILIWLALRLRRRQVETRLLEQN